MGVDPDALYRLLPAVYRQRDEERGGPLRQLLDVLNDELAVVADGVDQLYEDQFVETADAWVLPYLAELIGLRGLPSGSGTGITPRAEVANTIGYRRRKGTAAVLEQVARAVTGWPTRAVEFFELLAATQNVNHVRPANAVFAPVRDAARMEYVESPFERLTGQPDLTHTVDVRRIPRRHGRYNIPNVGLFCWRLRAYPLTGTPVLPAGSGEQRRFHLHPLGIPSPLFTLPVSEDEITHLAEPVNVPHPLARRELADNPGLYYGPGLSVHIAGVDAAAVDVCDLSDVLDGGGNVAGWGHTPVRAGRMALDPVLGRVAFGDDRADPPLATFRYGFGGDVGGGEYNRSKTFGTTESGARVAQQDPQALQTIEDGAAAVAGSVAGIVEIGDSGRYGGPADLTLNSRTLELRAGDRCRPTVVLEHELVIDGDGEGELTLNGLLITGAGIRVRNVRSVRLLHCTLVPGLAVHSDGTPTAPGVPSVIVESAGTRLTVKRCILGPVRVQQDAEAELVDCVCDAGVDGVAYAGDPVTDWGGRLTLRECTVLGRIRSRILDLMSNSILLASVPPGEDPDVWPGPVLAERRQEGCVRFSYVPPGSRTPRRHECQPATDADLARVRPVLRSTRYSDPTYCQLDQRTADEVRRGADDESEMGVFHHLFIPQRLAYLEARLDDYLRFGLEAGIFFAT